MTMDIAESLCMSWLRHVKGCQIVETNWKISHEWDIQNLEKIKDLQQKIKTSFPKNSEIFKQGKNKEFNVTNFMSIGETDVIGVKIQGDKIEKYYGIDVAFHKDGLGYGDTNENITRILKKSIRTAMLFYSYLGKKDADIIFATPKFKYTTQKGKDKFIKDVKYLLDKLETIFSGKGLSFKFDFVAENDFNDEILDPVILHAEDIHDTSELFARSMQLQNLFYANNAQYNQYNQYNQYKQLKIETEKEIINNISMSKAELMKLENKELIFDYFTKILEAGLVDSSEILKLQNDENYNTNKFGLTTNKILIPVTDLPSNKESVYYHLVIEIEGIKYKIYNQWKQNNKEKLVNWIIAHQKR